ncbi:MAG: hypothetical protein IAG13_27910 [Deltaproteobacteria bacterium]|nr:hypothetical protein [Nannocystaceae bacterium]
MLSTTLLALGLFEPPKGADPNAPAPVTASGLPASEDPSGFRPPGDASDPVPAGTVAADPVESHAEDVAGMPVVDMDNRAGAEVPGARPNVFPDSADQQGSRLGRLLSSRGGGPGGAGGWSFDFHGYFRAPMRVGQGTRDDAERADGQGKTTFHLPLVPDDQYLGYAYTLHNPRDWAELYFSVGNQVAAGTVSIQAFNFTDSSWKESNAQFGIAQAFVTLTPKLKAKKVALLWKIGSFDNRYGAAGRYDAGELDTYLFGRTHAMGESGRLEFTLNKFVLGLEHGLGATRPDPSVYNAARFTLLNHAHASLEWRNDVEVGFHYLQAFAREEDRHGPAIDAANRNLPDGDMLVLGPELRIDWGRIGYFYTGLSWIRARRARVVGPSIEVIHSKGGGQWNFGLIDNYLEGPDSDGDGNGTSNGNGEVLSWMLQTEHSLQKIMKGDSFWGEGRDLVFKLYTMVNHVKSDDEDVDGILKVKYGADALFSALSWFGVGARYTRVQPNSRVPEQSFSAISPRLVFRTRWVTREEISVSYTRYIYNQRGCGPDPVRCVQPPSAPVPPEGYGSASDAATNSRGAPTGNSDDPMSTADNNVFMIKATMWW